MPRFAIKAAYFVLAIVVVQPVVAGENNVPLSEQRRVAQSSSPLQAYLAKEDSSYRWHEIRNTELGGTKVVELILTSQTWRNIVWNHRLFIIKPEKVSTSKQAMLIVAGGKWKDEYVDPSYESTLPKEAALFATLAQQLESPVAVLLQVPQQPIFDNLKEDEIISYTFDRFLDTGDQEWPLLLPMVKSAVRSMDAIQEFCETQWSLSIESFTVTGGSKRGWTTWLAGAADPRVTAIAPMVIDMLNLRLQMDHQRETWGEFSPQISNYTEIDLQRRIKTPAGEALLSIVDPLAYRDYLTLPKLIVLGTNDPYWTLDALNLYWSELLGPKHILYVPNNGHGLRDLPRVLGAVSALHEQASGGERLPDINWAFQQANDKVTLTINFDTPPSECQVWIASSTTRDFRKSLWTASKASRDGDSYTFETVIPATGSKALIGELIYSSKHLPLFLSTNVHVMSSAEAALLRE